jgi:hypothetical protein
MRWHGLCLPWGGSGRRNSVAMHDSRDPPSTYIQMSIKTDIQTRTTMDTNITPSVPNPPTNWQPPYPWASHSWSGAREADPTASPAPSVPRTTIRMLQWYVSESNGPGRLLVSQSRFPPSRGRDATPPAVTPGECAYSRAQVST